MENLSHAIDAIDVMITEANCADTYVIGEFTVSKNTDELYDVFHLENILFEDLSLLSAAIAIVTVLEADKPELAREILFLESQFSKHYRNMQFFSNSKRWDLFENEKIDAEYCLIKIQTYVLPTNGK